MNCHTPVPSEEAEIFAEVFVCRVCHGRATRLWLRADKELRMLLMMQKEAIRLALIEGKLHFESTNVEDVSKTELMKTIVKMEEARTAARSANLPELPPLQGSR